MVLDEGRTGSHDEFMKAGIGTVVEGCDDISSWQLRRRAGLARCGRRKPRASDKAVVGIAVSALLVAIDGGRASASGRAPEVFPPHTTTELWST